MNMPTVHIEGIKELGYTDSEARFLYIVATHSGYFVPRQFLAGSERRIDAAGVRLPAVQKEDFHGVEFSFSLRQFGQYQGAGSLTGFGLRLRQPAQR